MNDMKKFLFASALGVMALGLHAQTWSQRLSAAERDYEEGRLTGIPERLQGGLDLKTKEGGFTHEERIRTHKLITKVYIFIDDEPKAEESLVNLLKTDKEHSLNPVVDPAELYFLYEKFRTKPIFRVAVKAGSNKSFPNVIETFSPSNTVVTEKIYNGNGDAPGAGTMNGTLGLGYWLEATAERHLWYGIEAGTGFHLRSSRYDVDNYVVDGATGEPTLSSYIANQQTYLRFPLYARYNFMYFKGSGPIPYVNLGLSYDFLLNAQYTEASRRGGTAFTLSTNNNLKDLGMVERSNMSATIGAGVKLRVKTHFLTLELRYDKSMFNYINENKRWNGNQFLTYDLAFVEDDLALDMISFSVGFTYSVYSPKKLKEFR